MEMSTGVVGLARSMNDMSGRLYDNGVSELGRVWCCVCSVLGWLGLVWSVWSGLSGLAMLMWWSRWKALLEFVRSAWDCLVLSDVGGLRKEQKKGRGKRRERRGGVLYRLFSTAA